MYNIPISIMKDPLIQDTGSRILYRDCQGSIPIPTPRLPGQEQLRKCGRQAAYLYTFRGWVSGKTYNIPLCEECAKHILGPESTDDPGINLKRRKLTLVSLKDWMNAVAKDYATRINGVRGIRVTNQRTGREMILYVKVNGIEEGL